MSRSTLSALLAVAMISKSVLAQPDPADPTPLVDKHYAYPSGIPYQVDNIPGTIRGPQVGFNICNSTTENQQSMCQTAMVNDISNFCLWAPPTPNSTIGDTEGEEVAWCSKPGYGTRIMPQGTLQGVQVLVTPAYAQFVGFIDQTQLNMNAQDYGGELDPHGADLRGNPIGGLLYSNFWSGSNSTYQQMSEWNEFIGGGMFCMTICNPASSATDQSNYCLNIYDRMGCSYNMPNNAQSGVFEVCDADYKIPVGTYVSNGVTMTYSQPASGAVNPPYTPVVPSSSNCVTYQSAALYTSLPAPTPTPSGTTKAATAGSSATGVPSSGTGASAAKPAPTSNSATALGISSLAGVLGTLFAVAFLS